MFFSSYSSRSAKKVFFVALSDVVSPTRRDTVMAKEEETKDGGADDAKPKFCSCEKGGGLRTKIFCM